MSDISHNDIRRVDPTSLMVFLALMRHRKGTVAALELGLTQPAISHSLKRMREVYGDPLFLRRSHGLEPTALARDLEPKIREIIHLIGQSLAPSAEFIPSDAIAQFRLGAFDFELTTILPALVARLRQHAPNIAIHSFQIANEQALDALRDGQLDMLVGYLERPWRDDPSMVQSHLYSETYVAVARRCHPLLAGPFTWEEFARADHLQVSPSGPKRNIIDHALQLEGLSRNVRTIVPSLFSALAVLQQTDLIGTLPKRVAAQHAERFDLAFRPLPMTGRAFDLHAVRHMRDARNAMHQWMVDQIKAAASDVSDVERA
ncbi:MAG: LysR substrate-binding domain-containing protein [Pseudomonadota bacterium]